mmetsp:Transcript_63606/g.176922  ORF Transcript_63606/g.176922 Transcript_63606/m.176922 type:complete len:101 (+) Transcript_63606:128-430(+)
MGGVAEASERHKPNNAHRVMRSEHKYVTTTGAQRKASATGGEVAPKKAMKGNTTADNVTPDRVVLSQLGKLVGGKKPLSLRASVAEQKNEGISEIRERFF